MSMKTRIQGPLEAVVVTAGVVGTSPEVYDFHTGEVAGGAKQYVRPCILTNKHATINMYVKVNEANASDTDHHFLLKALSSLDVSVGGIVNVDTVSVYIAATAAFTDLQVHGWPA